jgi:putative membrane protein
MLIEFSKNPIRRTIGILYYNRKPVILFFLWSLIVYAIDKWLEYDLSIPVIPVTIMGGALAIFLAFKNNSAYDRWWEARKIWGGIVNVSRNFGTQVIAYIEDEEIQKRLVLRHIAWLYSLAMHLRKELDLEKVKSYLDPDVYHMLTTAKNVPVQILHQQGVEVTDALREGRKTEFQHSMVMGDIKEMYALQGKAERIKNTVFPYYYNYYTGVFLWLFIFLLPCALVDQMNAFMIPVTVGIAFVFVTLDKTGKVTEDPFENRAADTPMLALCRTIEIDLMQQIQAEEVPESLKIEYTRFGAAFYR